MVFLADGTTFSRMTCHVTVASPTELPNHLCSENDNEQSIKTVAIIIKCNSLVKGRVNLLYDIKK